MTDRRLHDRALKRAIDIVGSAAALALLSPVISAAAAAILVTQGRPILFYQRRPGLGGVPFTIVKFRTMREPIVGELRFRTDEERLTRLGRFMRTTSIDELPELWNVLRGDMSLVGPRPLLMDYLDSYTPQQARRHATRPGITGWAIVNGRNHLGFSERLELDAWYVEHWSLRLDVQILIATVAQVLRRRGAVAAQDVDALGFPLSAPAASIDAPPTLPDGRHGPA